MIQFVSRALAFIALLVLSPLLVITGLAVLLLQGRPVLFRQQRSGLHLQPFSLIKFRSMRDTRDSEGELLPDLERTTRIGNFLRYTRLDEVPGLWNIVKGDMALVGPRPLLPHTVEALGPVGVKRASVRPGITGWAQINGNTLLTLDEKVALDIWYIENRNWRLDLWILVKTLLVATGGERINVTAVEEARINE